MCFHATSMVHSFALRSRCFNFCEDLFDNVEIGAVGRREEQTSGLLISLHGSIDTVTVDHTAPS